MRDAAFLLDADHRLVPTHVDRTLAERGDDARPRWVHLEGFDGPALQSWLARLDLRPFLLNRLLRFGHGSKVVAVSDALVADVRVLPGAEDDRFAQLAILCLPGLIVTMSPRASDADDALARVAPELEISVSSTAGVLAGILHHEISRLAIRVRAVRASLASMDERMDVDVTSVPAEEILAAKDEVLRLVAIAEEQLESVETICEAPTSALAFEDAPGSARLLLSIAGATERMALRLEKRCTELRERADAHRADQMNGRLAVLTILSAVFLPLSLMAGVWGMNFESMPELALPGAYPLALSAMAIVGASMVLYFVRRGWFR